MFRYFGISIVLFGGLLVATSAPAAPRSRHVQPGQTHVDPYVPPVRAHYSGDRRIQTRIVSDALQINPGYSSFYAPDGYDGATQQDILAELRRQGFRLDQLATLVQTKPAVPGTAPAAPIIVVPVPVPKTAGPPPSAAVGLAVLNDKCAKCHQEGKLATDQRFTLLDAKGTLVSLTDRQKFTVLGKVFSDEMPKQPNSFGIPLLQDQDKLAVLALIRGN